MLGVNLNDGENFERSMQELKSLAEACQMEVTGQMTQNLAKPHNALYMGRGKIGELQDLLEQVLAVPPQEIPKRADVIAQSEPITGPNRNGRRSAVVPGRHVHPEKPAAGGDQI